MLIVDPLQHDNDRVILIDGDILVYRAAALSEGAETPSLSFDVVAGMMQRFQADLQTTEYVVMFSSPINFRRFLYPDYKSDRKASKPKFYDEVKSYTAKTYDCETWAAVEADDAIVSTAIAYLAGGQYTPVIVSLDKDLKQVPNTLYYNLVTGALETITAEAAYTNLFIQCLTGDTVDHVGGIKGVGKKKAQKLIENHTVKNLDELYKTVVDIYLRYGYTEKDASAVYNCIVMQTDLPLLQLKGFDMPDLICEQFGMKALKGDFDDYIYRGRIPNLPI